MTEVEWTPKALDLLEGLDTEAQERLVKKLDEAKDWTSHRLEKLSGYPYYKLRAGDYRAIITSGQAQSLALQGGENVNRSSTRSTSTAPLEEVLREETIDGTPLGDVVFGEIRRYRGRRRPRRTANRRHG